MVQQVGSSSAETLTGTSGSDLLYAGGGNDVVYAGGGDDRAYGGTGDDRMYGGSGNDEMHGEAGSDRLHGESGNDRLYGGAGRDFLYGDAGDDRLFGGGGFDNLQGGEGADWFVVRAQDAGLLEAEDQANFYTSANISNWVRIEDLNFDQGDILNLVGFNLPSGVDTQVNSLDELFTLAQSVETIYRADQGSVTLLLEDVNSQVHAIEIYNSFFFPV